MVQFLPEDHVWQDLKPRHHYTCKICHEQDWAYAQQGSYPPSWHALCWNVVGYLRDGRIDDIQRIVDSNAPYITPKVRAACQQFLADQPVTALDMEYDVPKPLPGCRFVKARDLQIGMIVRRRLYQNDSSTYDSKITSQPLIDEAGEWWQHKACVRYHSGDALAGNNDHTSVCGPDDVWDVVL